MPYLAIHTSMCIKNKVVTKKIFHTHRSSHNSIDKKYNHVYYITSDTLTCTKITNQFFRSMISLKTATAWFNWLLSNKRLFEGWPSLQPV